MKVLITGVAGFIGSELAKRLKDQYKVIGIDDLNYNLGLGNDNNIPNGIEFHNINIKDHKAINKIILENDIKVIYHLAAISDTRCDDEKEINLVNVEASKTFLKLLDLLIFLSYMHLLQQFMLMEINQLIYMLVQN